MLSRPLDKEQFRRWIAEGWRVPMLACYDAPTARSLWEGGVRLLLVGDSVGPVLLGLASVREVTVGMIAHHTAAVRRGAPEAVVVADVPDEAMGDARSVCEAARRLAEAGADMVKIEADSSQAPLVRALSEKGFWVMGHTGHKPQRHEGGSRVEGATAASALRVFHDAMALAEAGASAVLFECVPERVAGEITRRLKVPTIGIGAGNGCRGQVLVAADMLGWYDNPFRFLIRLDDFAGRAKTAAAEYARLVVSGEFPAPEHTFKIREEEWLAFLEALPEEPAGPGEKAPEA